jgi:hypothetical protein
LLALQSNTRQFLTSTLPWWISAYAYQPNRLESLSTSLREFEVGVLKDQERISLHRILNACQNVLEELQKEVDQYKCIDSTSKSMSSRSRRVFYRLKWDEKKIEHFRSRINSHVNALNALNIKHIWYRSLSRSMIYRH